MRRSFFAVNSILALLFVLAATSGVPGQVIDTVHPPESAPDDAQMSDLAKLWGIEIVGLRLSAAGYMLDFRYRVVDAGKAAPIFLRKNQPVLIHQESGHKFVIATPATVGPLRSSNPPKAGRTYFMLFSNPGGYVKEGNKVSIRVGDFEVKDLEVQE